MPRAHVAAASADALAQLARGLGPGPFAAVILFASPDADLPSLERGLPVFGDTPVIGCTTAGEISGDGYAEGEIVAIGLPAALFAAQVLAVPDLSALDGHALIGGLIRARAALAQERPDWDTEFAFLMVDGTSLREDALTAALGPGLGPVPLFGGSAGDGLRFGRAMVLWGHAPKSQTRMVEMKTAMEKLDLLVVVDPFPTVSAVLHDRTDGVYLLPASTQFETRGSVTASNRSIQWREQVIAPLFESKPDHVILAKFAKKFGFEDRIFRNIGMDGEDEPNI